MLLLRNNIIINFKGCVEGDHWSIVQRIEFTSWIVSWVNFKGQYAFLKRNVFIFRHRECFNQYRKAVDEKRKKINSILKECFFVLKGFDQFPELKTIAKKSSHVPLNNRISLFFRLKWTFVKRKLIEILRIDKHTALRSFCEYSCLKHYHNLV